MRGREKIAGGTEARIGRGGRGGCDECEEWVVGSGQTEVSGSMSRKRVGGWGCGMGGVGDGGRVSSCHGNLPCPRTSAIAATSWLGSLPRGRGPLVETYERDERGRGTWKPVKTYPCMARVPPMKTLRKGRPGEPRPRKGPGKTRDERRKKKANLPPQGCLPPRRGP